MCALCALSVGTPRRTAVVITGGWCAAQKKMEHTEDTTSHGEKIKEKKKEKKGKKKRKKKGKKKEVPSIELANFDWIV